MPDQPDDPIEDAVVNVSPALTFARLSRRATIGAAGAGIATLAAGCTDHKSVTPALLPGARITPQADPDVALAATVLADERRLLARLDATIAHHPALGSVLAPARAVHEAHVELLADAAPKASSPSPVPSSTPSSSSATDSTVPARVGVALRALATSEHALALLDQRSALAARSGPFARVLGSMAAAAAQQAATMTSAASARGAQGRHR